MVIFGAPTDMRAAEQACRAARCAQDMQRAIRSQNKTWSKQGVPEMRMRVGIHHGPAVVGHFGSQERLEYTAIGHTVNVASRIESACAPGDIYVSGQVADLLPEDVVVEAGEHLLKGISGEQLLYSLPLDSALGNDKDEAAA